MLTPSLPTEATAGNPVSAWRRIQAGMVATSAAGAPRTGVLAASSPNLVTGTADLAMTYQIGQFVAAPSRDGVGVEFVGNDATETVSTTAAPGSNSRIDVIWVRCRFPSLTDSGQTDPLFGVTQGVANASPSKPSIPAGALELATAVVTSSDLTTQTVVITQTFRWTAYAGGTVWLRNQAEMDAWAPADGSLAYRLDLSRLYVRRNGAWGSVSPLRRIVTSGASGSLDTTIDVGTVTVPADPFGAGVPYDIVVTAYSSASGPVGSGLAISARVDGAVIASGGLQQEVVPSAGVTVYPRIVARQPVTTTTAKTVLVRIAALGSVTIPADQTGFVVELVPTHTF